MHWEKSSLTSIECFRLSHCFCFVVMQPTTWRGIYTPSEACRCIYALHQARFCHKMPWYAGICCKEPYIWRWATKPYHWEVRLVVSAEKQSIFVSKTILLSSFAVKIKSLKNYQIIWIEKLLRLASFLTFPSTRDTSWSWSCLLLFFCLNLLNDFVFGSVHEYLFRCCFACETC